MKNTNSGLAGFNATNCGKLNVNVDFYINAVPEETKQQHEYWKIILVFGNDLINVVNGERIELKAEEAIIVRPDDTYFVQRRQDNNYQLLCIKVKKEFFEEVLNLFSPTTLLMLKAYPKNIPKIKCSFANYQKILHLMRLSHRDLESGGERRQFLSKELLMCILFEYEEQFCAEQINDKRNRSFSTVMITLFNQIENIGLKLHEVCAKYPCSVEYAVRRFKVEGLETPNMVFRKIKLDYACTLLKSSDYKILTISEKIGFNNLGHFNKLFFQTYGVSPKEFQKKHCAKNK